MDAERERQRLEAELDAFTYAIAHDLRTVAGASARLAAMIDDLAALSRLSRASLERRPVALRPLVDEVVRELPLQGRELEWRIAPLPTLSAHRALLRVVLYQLLSNAAKFTRPASKAVIDIAAESDGTVLVRDNGIGFDMRHADRLFGLFQRLHRDEQFEGSGVGLATARRIVNRHGGSIWADAVPQAGATFRFTLGS